MVFSDENRVPGEQSRATLDKLRHAAPSPQPDPFRAAWLPAGIGGGARGVLALQRSVGNATTARQLAARSSLVHGGTVQRALDDELTKLAQHPPMEPDPSTGVGDRTADLVTVDAAQKAKYPDKADLGVWTASYSTDSKILKKLARRVQSPKRLLVSDANPINRVLANPAFVVLYDSARHKFKLVMAASHVRAMQYAALTKTEKANAYPGKANAGYAPVAAGELAKKGDEWFVRNKTGTFGTNATIARLQLTREFFDAVLPPTVLKLKMQEFGKGANGEDIFKDLGPPVRPGPVQPPPVAAAPIELDVTSEASALLETQSGSKRDREPKIVREASEGPPTKTTRKEPGSSSGGPETTPKDEPE